MSRAMIAPLLLLLVAALAAPAAARSLQQIKEGGTIGLCAHPNSLPFAKKDGARHGFQIELAQALAHRLGVRLTEEWVTTGIDIFRTDCDIVMETIADPEAQLESGLKLSRPYRRSGVALVVRAGEKKIHSVRDMGASTKVGVLASSLVAMRLNEAGIETVPDLFEDEILSMLADGEIDAAAVTPTSAGYFNMTHAKDKKAVRVIDAFREKELSWNMAVGMRRPDPALKAAIDDALAKMLADGTIKRIYARYGVTIQPPRE